MLGPPSTELVAGLQALVVAALLLGLGYLVAGLIAGAREIDETTRWGLSLFGLCAFAFVSMVVHLITRGWFFSHPGVVGIVLIVSFAALLVRRMTRRSERDRSHLWIAGLLVVASV